MKVIGRTGSRGQVRTARTHRLAAAARVVPGQGIIFLSVDVVYDAIAGLAGEAAA